MIKTHTYILVNIETRAIVDVVHFKGDVMQGFRPARMAERHWRDKTPAQRIFFMLSNEAPADDF